MSTHSASSLLEAARDAYTAAYVPYSEYPVGAAFLTEAGTVYTGTNIENANFSNSLHAEEVALSNAWMAEDPEFVALAVASAAGDGVTPCGMCRQTLIELCPASMPVYCGTGDGYEEHRLETLIPAAISEETLEDAA